MKDLVVIQGYEYNPFFTILGIPKNVRVQEMGLCEDSYINVLPPQIRRDGNAASRVIKTVHVPGHDAKRGVTQSRSGSSFWAGNGHILTQHFGERA